MRVSRPIPLSFLFTGLLLFGCGATAAPSPASEPSKPSGPGASSATGATAVKPDAEGRLSLAVSDRAEVAPGAILTLESVVSDSRCPVDVVCVWAGEIRVALAFELQHSEAPRIGFELATTAPSAEVRGLRFELLGATPAPHSKKPIAAGDYRISLRVRPSSESQPSAGAKS
jgi:hypothetical protein